MIPVPLRKLRSLAGNFPAWMRAVEGWLGQLDNRLRNVTVAQAGWIVVWPTGAAVAPNATPCDGQLLLIADHPDLYEVIGATYNTGGELPTEFRVPNIPAPVVGFTYIIIG